MKEFLVNVGATLLIVLPAAAWFVRQQISSQFASIAERYRYQLKNAENVFARRLSAAEELGAYIESLRPKADSLYHSWDDVIEHIAYELPSIAEWASDFVRKHNAVLSQKEINGIHAALVIAEEGSIRMTPEQSGQPFNIDSGVRESAEVAYKSLSESYSDIKADVYERSNIEIPKDFFSETLPRLKERLTSKSSGRCSSPGLVDTNCPPDRR